MKKILLSLVLSFVTILGFATEPHIEQVRVDAKKSNIKWIGSKVTSSHEGNVSIAKGVLSINHGTLVGGEIGIDMNSITCTDIESERKNRYLVEHLKNEDFFHTDVFPLAIIKIINAIKTEGNLYKIEANLTIKDITHPIKFDANVNINKLDFLAKAKIVIDRTKWNVKYGSGSFFDNLGDKMILDDIEFEVLLLSGK